MKGTISEPVFTKKLRLSIRMTLPCSKSQDKLDANNGPLDVVFRDRWHFLETEVVPGKPDAMLHDM